MRNVFIAYMHKDEWSHSFGKSLQQMTNANPGGYISEVGDARCNPGGLPDGRNGAMRSFLDNRTEEWLFFIDTDMGFKPTALAALMAVAHPDERPIVGGLCFAQRELKHDGRNGHRWEPRPTIFDFVDFPDGRKRFSYRMHYPVNGLVQCDATGAAFVLIHRSAGEKMRDRFGETWFDRIQDPDGLMSEDLSFFKRWMDITGRGGCHIHTGVKTTHAKTTWMDERDFWDRLPVLPATEAVDVIVPVLHRPQNVRPFMTSLRASTGLAKAWFVCERSDSEEQAEVERHGGRVLRCDGSFATKVNYAYNKIKSDAPWVLLAGDDVMFHPGWLDHAQQVAVSYGAKVIGTNDLGNPRVMSGDHATHLLIHRDYIAASGGGWDGPGVVCHEGYGHQYVDDEIVFTAKQRGVWQMALGSHVEHMHPLWEKGQHDAVYELGQSFAANDRKVFLQRIREHAPEFAPPAPPPVKNLFEHACATPSDINEHLRFIHDLVIEENAEKVIELGVRGGNSTVALLAAVEETCGHLWSVDIVQPLLFETVTEHEQWTFILGDDLDVGHRATPLNIDVLFIDTSHTYDQTKAELDIYGPRARVILLHDTELERPEASPPTDPPYPVKTAVEEWCAKVGREFTNHPHNNGLGVIR